MIWLGGIREGVGGLGLRGANEWKSRILPPRGIKKDEGTVCLGNSFHWRIREPL